MKPGERVGPFEITASIGAGGMGEVYRARDTRLNRDVAIKILPEAFAADADRVSRFTREAQSLAALNRPHIAQIYGVEETPSTGTAPPTRALVMELVDGETLADRIARGAIPSDETVAIARQMAEALEAAHGAGIIHRDLKPANIKLRPDGTVKVLDFGLAKAIEPASVQGSPSLVNSPTLSFMATQAGVILGTASADRRLKKVSVGGGPAQILCDAPLARGGAWGRDGDVLFNPTVGSGLVRVSSNGGPITPVTTIAAGQTDHRFPSFLPDGRHFLYYAGGENAIYAASLGGGESKLLVKEAGTASAFAPTGHLLYGRDHTLMAQPFDAAGLATTGEPFPIAEGVSVTFAGLLSFSVSESGTVVYGTNPIAHADWQQLFWLDREGTILGKVGQPYAFKGMDLSPDEKRLAFHRDEGSGGDVWIMDLERGVASQLTFDGPHDHAGSPHWSPNGRQVLFQRQRANKWSFWLKEVDGSGAEDLLFETDVRSNPMAWAPDGLSIVFQHATKVSPDLWLLPVVGERKPVAIWESPSPDMYPQVSPDGRWIAFVSTESGRSEVHVRAFPGGSARRRVSDGIQPRWRGDGRELFYLSGLSGAGGGQVMSVELRPNGPLLEVGEPRALFDSGYVTAGPDLVITYHTYAVSRDGKRFLIPRPASTASTVPDRIDVIVNWAATLRQ